jgi:hypothetical protein
LTTSFADVALKLVPVIVTAVPTGPLAGETPVIVGGETVKLLPLVAVRAPTATVIFPVVAASGTGTTIFVVVADVGVAVVPLNLTTLLTSVVLKLVPVIVTGVPAGPLVGEKLVIVGGETVKLPLLVPVELPTVIVILPVVALRGTVTISFVVVADVGVAAAVPLNLTELFAGVLLKFVPVIVTAVPTGPLVGLKLEMVGAAARAVRVVTRAARIRISTEIPERIHPKLRLPQAASCIKIPVAYLGERCVMRRSLIKP